MYFIFFCSAKKTPRIEDELNMYRDGGIFSVEAKLSVNPGAHKHPTARR